MPLHISPADVIFMCMAKKYVASIRGKNYHTMRPETAQEAYLQDPAAKAWQKQGVTIHSVFNPLIHH